MNFEYKINSLINLLYKTNPCDTDSFRKTLNDHFPLSEKAINSPFSGGKTPRNYIYGMIVGVAIGMTKAIEIYKETK